MKRLIAALVLFALVAPALAESPEGAGYADVRLQLSGYSPKPQTLYLPQNDDRQAVDYGKLPVQHDSYGNAFLTVEGNYSFAFDVVIDASKPQLWMDQKFPAAAASDTTYLQGSPYIQPDDEEIIQRALDATRNSHTVLQAMKDLTLWTNAYITYDTAYWGSIVPSAEVLANKRGVCDEYTNVYTAMARSLGVPTRVATGIVYTGTQWQRHAWAETLIGDTWVPTDPTFGEIGMVNALHVKLYHAPTYLFYQFPQSLEDAAVLQYSLGPYDVPIQISSSVSPTTVPPKGRFTLYANVTNAGTTILVPTYAAQKTVGVDLLSDFRQSEIINPGETKQIQWTFAAPYGERETYYVFLVGPLADEKYAITVDPTLSAEGYSDLEISNVYASARTGEIVIDAKVRNRGSSDYAAVIATVTTDIGTQQQSFALTAGQSQAVEFTFPASTGTHSYELQVDAGNSTTNTFGTVAVAETREGKSVTQVLSEFATAHAAWIYFAIAIIIAGALVLILLVPLQEERKIPFEEREEWAKLMKLRQG